MNQVVSPDSGSSSQSYGNGLGPRSPCTLQHAKDDSDIVLPYLDFLHERSNYFSSAMPVRIHEVRPNGCRNLAKSFRCESHVLHLVYVAGVSLNLSVKLCDAAFGSSHPRSELILFDQALSEAIDQPLKRMLLFETPDF